MFLPLFWFFAALTLIFGVLVIVNRSPVASALSLVVSFLGLAALFVGLDAYLIGVLQVLVYAGAVMVLFLFIIMLLDLKAEQRRRLNLLGVIGGGVVTLGFVLQLFFVLAHLPNGANHFPPLLTPVAIVIEKATPAKVLAQSNEQDMQVAHTRAAQIEASSAVAKVDDVKQIGDAIFSRYNLPLQVVGVLILVATVGVVVLSKRELK